jgi:hypothetical protein
MRTSTLAAAAALSVSLITPVSSKDDPSPLTTMDYVALRQLAARHAWALDSGADNGYAFAEAPADQWALVGRRGGAPTSIGGRYEVVLDIGQNGQPGSVYLGGHYEDVYVKTPDGWRFKTRRSFGSVSGPL